MAKKKKVILIFTKYYLPGYKSGGPIQSMSNLVAWCGDDYRFKIITGDRDSRESKPYENIRLNQWNTVGNAQVFYLKKKNITPFYLLQLLRDTEYDFIYFNSFLRLQFSVMPLLLLKFITDFDLGNVLLAPRGEFSPGALEIKSIKKKWFLKFVKYLGIYDRINWQATNEDEIRDIKRNINVKKQNIYLVPNLPQKETSIYSDVFEKDINTLHIIFLSRVSPIKNLKYALNILKMIKNIRIQFDIYGVISDEKYWQDCKRIINSMPGNHTICYKGTIEHDLVIETISKYHLFFLPTRGENYGHAIYESFIAGTPVLISDQTPWQGLANRELGWDIPLSNQKEFIEIIKKIGAMDTLLIKQIKERVKKEVKKIDIHNKIKQNKKVLNILVD